MKTKAASNERIFKEFFEANFGKNILGGKVSYSSDDKSVRISVDESISTAGKKILIEVDSGNMAKLLVGQYVLLNELVCSDIDETIFVTLHFYAGYNPERTTNNLKLINNNLYSGLAIPHCSYSFDGFKELCSKLQSVEQLIDALTSASKATAKGGE